MKIFIIIMSILLFYFFQFAFSQSCTDTLFLENHTVTGTETYDVSNKIIVARNNFIVAPGGNCVFKTDCAIHLEPGFVAQAGSEFHAFIVDNVAPTCNFLSYNPGPPVSIEVLLHDAQSGIALVEVVKLKNATLEIPEGSGNFYNQGDLINFSPPVATALTVEAVKINQTASSYLTLHVTDDSGNEITCDPVYSTLSALIPQEYDLKQNYPNPFNPTTTIYFDIAANNEGTTPVKLIIYDLLGRQVKTLINKEMQPGEYSAKWDGTNKLGEAVAGSVYIYRLVAGDFTSTKKMILLK